MAATQNARARLDAQREDGFACAKSVEEMRESGDCISLDADRLDEAPRLLRYKHGLVLGRGRKQMDLL